jgi:DNA adenine methylase
MKVGEYCDRIFVSCDDGVRFIDGLDAKSTFFFIDPPYFEKGPALYLNALDECYHSALAARLKTMSDAAWVLTYDDCLKVRELYRGWATIRPFSLRYAATDRRNGREVLISPRWMQLPTIHTSAALTW